MTDDKVVLVKMKAALRTHEWIITGNHLSLNFLLLILCFLLLLYWLLLFYHFDERIRSFFTCSPNAAHLQNGSELGSFEFVNVMVYFVRAIHEIRVGSIDSDLNLTVDLIVEFDVDHNVVSRLFESVFYPDDFKVIWLIFA